MSRRSSTSGPPYPLYNSSPDFPVDPNRALPLPAVYSVVRGALDARGLRNVSVELEALEMITAAAMEFVPFIYAEAAALADERRRSAGEGEG
jgi:hypothetical protein